MAQYYYLNPQNQQCGPVDESLLLTYGVTAETLVWTAGMPNWLPANQVPGLQSLFTTAAYQSTNPTPSHNQTPYPAVQPSKPDSNLVWGIVTTLLCCLPLGIYSIICASRVDGLYNSGDYEGAQKAADEAKRWATYSAIAGLIIYAIAVLSELAQG